MIFKKGDRVRGTSKALSPLTPGTPGKIIETYSGIHRVLLEFDLMTKKKELICMTYEIELDPHAFKVGDLVGPASPKAMEIMKSEGLSFPPWKVKETWYNLSVCLEEKDGLGFSPKKFILWVAADPKEKEDSSLPAGYKKGSDGFTTNPDNWKPGNWLI